MMLEYNAAYLLSDAKGQLDVLRTSPSPAARRRAQAAAWFALNHAWTILTGAKLPGSTAVH